MQLLRQSTAQTVKLGPFLDSSDGDTEEAGLSIEQADIRVSKDGGAFAQTNNTAGATHDEKGWYGIPLDSTDTSTLGELVVHVHVSGALPVWGKWQVVPANVYDALVSGSDKLQVDAAEISGSSTAADNVESNIGNLDTSVSSRSSHGDPDPSGYIDAAISSRSTFDASTDTVTLADGAHGGASASLTLSDYSDFQATGFSTHSAADVWTVGTRQLTGAANITSTGGTLYVDANGYVQIEGTANQLDDLNDVSQAEVNAACDTALTDYDAVVPGDLPTNFSSLSITAGGLVDVDDSTPIDANVTQAGGSAIQQTGGELHVLDGDGNAVATASAVSGLNDLSASEVNAEVVDVIYTDTHTEVSSVPAANAALGDKIGWIFATSRNKVTQTATTQTVRDDGDAADIGSASVSDDGTTFTRGEFT